MTPLLQQALSKVQQLPDEQQDAIASLILDELADEARWEQSFANSQQTLARLAEKAREDVRRRRIR